MWEAPGQKRYGNGQVREASRDLQRTSGNRMSTTEHSEASKTRKSPIAENDDLAYEPAKPPRGRA
jgi:hypothetical protein